jgi:hypothetical protein
MENEINYFRLLFSDSLEKQRVLVYYIGQHLHLTSQCLEDLSKPNRGNFEKTKTMSAINNSIQYSTRLIELYKYKQLYPPNSLLKIDTIESPVLKTLVYDLELMIPYLRRIVTQLTFIRKQLDDNTESSTLKLNIPEEKSVYFDLLSCGKGISDVLTSFETFISEYSRKTLKTHLQS